MNRAPAEFAELLTARGRRILEGQEPSVRGALADPRRRFLALSGAIDARAATALRELVDRTMNNLLVPMEDRIPAWTISAMKQDYAELLPKTVRVRTAMLDERRERSYRAAESIGLVRLLRSDSFHQFATVLTGRALKRRWGIQALCYGPGDYSGPHNDHHPEEKDARDGYLDLHLTLAGPGVANQWLVYEEDGHFSRMQDVNSVGGITAYRLPFWHFTTPLQAMPGQAAKARRWVLLGTFLFRRSTSPNNPRQLPE